MPTERKTSRLLSIIQGRISLAISTLASLISIIVQSFTEQRFCVQELINFVISFSLILVLYMIINTILRHLLLKGKVFNITTRVLSITTFSFLLYILVLFSFSYCCCEETTLQKTLVDEFLKIENTNTSKHSNKPTETQSIENKTTEKSKYILIDTLRNDTVLYDYENNVGIRLHSNNISKVKQKKISQIIINNHNLTQIKTFKKISLRDNIWIRMNFALSDFFASVRTFIVNKRKRNDLNIWERMNNFLTNLFRKKKPNEDVTVSNEKTKSKRRHKTKSNKANTEIIYDNSSITNNKKQKAGVDNNKKNKGSNNETTVNSYQSIKKDNNINQKTHIQPNQDNTSLHNSTKDEPSQVIEKNNNADTNDIRKDNIKESTPNNSKRNDYNYLVKKKIWVGYKIDNIYLEFIDSSKCKTSFISRDLDNLPEYNYYFESKSQSVVIKEIPEKGSDYDEDELATIIFKFYKKGPNKGKVIILNKKKHKKSFIIKSND